MTERTSALAAIEGHRDRIDELDRRIVALLNERATESLAIRALKPAAGMELYDPAREDAIFARVEGYSAGPLTGEGLRAMYGTLLTVMKETPAPKAAAAPTATASAAPTAPAASGPAAAGPVSA